MAHLIYLNSYEFNLSDLSHSQICQRVRFVICEAEDLRVRSERPCGRPIGLSRTPGDRTLPAEAMHLAVKSVRRARGSYWPVCVRGRSDSHTASHFGLSDLRPHRFESPICEAVRGRGRPSTASQTDHMTLW